MHLESVDFVWLLVMTCRQRYMYLHVVLYVICSCLIQFRDDQFQPRSRETHATHLRPRLHIATQRFKSSKTHIEFPFCVSVYVRLHTRKRSSFSNHV